MGSIIETIAPGAFRSSLTGDVIALFDHDPGKVLARTGSGTLRLSEDTRGLAFDFEIPDTSAGRDILTLAERGDLGGMSFGFVTPKGGDDWQGERRTLRNVLLKEISVVSSWPAYPDTQLALRSRDMALGDRGARARRLIMAELGAWG